MYSANGIQNNEGYGDFLVGKYTYTIVLGLSRPIGGFLIQ